MRLLLVGTVPMAGTVVFENDRPRTMRKRSNDDGTLVNRFNIWDRREAPSFVRGRRMPVECRGTQTRVDVGVSGPLVRGKAERSEWARPMREQRPTIHARGSADAPFS